MPTYRRLIDPEPVSVKTMTSWSKFTAQLQAWTLSDLKGRASQFIDDQIRAYRPVGQEFQRNLKQAGDDELVEELILAALKAGALHAYVYHMPHNHCFKTEPFFWHVVLDHFDAIDAIRDGICPVELMKFADQTPERDLANGPLFVHEAAAKEFLKLKPSAAQLEEEAGEIIATQKRKWGSRPMLKPDFAKELMHRCPGCTKNRAEQIWSETVPSAWRHQGRRKQS